MFKVETPELFCNLDGKPLHRTGEIHETDYFKRLNPSDRSSLIILLRHLQSIASSMNTQVHTLAVGSSADLQSEYGDIDLLICPDDLNVRSEFVRQTLSQLYNDKNFLVRSQFPKGSSPIFNSPHAPYKLFVQPVQTVDAQQFFGLFDMTFLGENGGLFSETVSIHQKYNLAFCKLSDNLH